MVNIKGGFSAGLNKKADLVKYMIKIEKENPEISWDAVPMREKPSRAKAPMKPKEKAPAKAKAPAKEPEKKRFPIKRKGKPKVTITITMDKLQRDVKKLQEKGASKAEIEKYVNSLVAKASTN